MKHICTVVFLIVLILSVAHAQANDIVVTQFGALGNGIHDDAPAIRAALNSAKKADCVVFPAGSYLLQSGSGFIYGDNEYILVLPGNIEIRGERGAQLKIGDGLAYKTSARRGMALIFAENCNDISISNMRFELNGANNLVPDDSRQITGYALRLYNCNNTRISNCEIMNGYGQNAIVISGYASNGCEITNNIIINGGTSIIGNRYQDDYSAIYSCAQNTLITGNRIASDCFPFANSGAVEIHNSDSIVENNIFEKCQPGIYICSDFSGKTTERIAVRNNKFLRCNRGIFFDGTGDFADIDISGNYFGMKRFQQSSKFSLAAAIQTRRTDSPVYDYTQIIKKLNVSDNEMNEEFIDMPLKASACFARIASVYGGIFKNNRISHISGQAFELLGSPFGMKNIFIVDNQVCNFGLNRSPYSHAAIDLYFSGSSKQPPKKSFSASNLYFFNNSFVMEKEYSIESCGFSAGYDQKSGLTNIIYGGNSFTGVKQTTQPARIILNEGSLPDNWQAQTQDRQNDQL
ncbi:MAG: glycosyl hydrolase family 28-related protein [Negativicutes bacterium]|jgi:hypothetical protein